MATIEFHGADLVVYFNSNPANVSVDHYVIDYQCKNGTVTHRVDQASFQAEATNGVRSYQDTLTFAENQGAGQTRNVRVSVRAVSDAGSSSADIEDAQNSLPVLSSAPVITSTLTGVEIAVPAPTDGDLSGYVAWVGTTADFPLDAAHERYRGAANAISLQLPTDDTYFVRIAPFDAFGLDTFSAWDAQQIKRGDLNSAVGATPVVQGFAQAQAEIAEAVGKAQSDAADAKQQIADTRTQLDTAVGEAKTAADAAKADAASVRTDLIPQVDAAKAAAKKASDDLEAEIARAKGAEGTITTTVTTAQKRADDAYTAVTTETTQRQDGDTLLSQRIDTVESTATTDKGALDTRITNEVATLVKADEAIGKRVDSVVSQANTDRSDYTAKISDEATTRATQTDALGRRVDSVVAQATTDRGDFNAAISREETARAAVDQALSDKVDVVEAKLRGDTDSGIAAQIRDQATASANRDSALGTRIQTVEANYVTNAQADAKVAAEATARSSETGALANRIGKVETSYSGAGNLLGNTAFTTTAGWNLDDNGMGMNPLVTQTGDYWDPRGETVLFLTKGGASPAGSYAQVTSEPFAVSPNSFIQFYAYTSSHRSKAWTSVFYYDENGAWAGYAGETDFSTVRIDAGGPDLTGWDQTGRKSVKVPGNARSARFAWRIYDSGGSNPCGWFFHPYVGQAREGQTEWNPYSPGSGKQTFIATNACISDEATASANRDSALATRADALESSVNTGPNNLGSLAGRISDEATARTQNDNAISTRVQTVEAKAKNIANSYTAVSRGNSAVAKFGRGGGVYNVDGGNMTGGGRGYRVNVFDSANTLIASNLYDTLAGDRGFSLGGAGDMANFLNGITEGQAVVITTDDEPATNRLTGGLVEAMERCGAGALFSGNTFKYRGAYILVGQAGIGRGNGNEYYSGSIDNGPDAWIEARFDLLNGRPQLNGAGKAILETSAAIKDEATARADAVSAVANRTNTLETSVSNGGNLLSNTDNDFNTARWNYAQEAATGSGRDAITGNNWWPVGIHPLVMGQENGSTNRGGFWWQDVYGIEVGKTYQASMYTASHRCDTQVYIDCFNSGNAVIANFTSPLVSFGGNDGNAPLSSWARPFVNFVVPAGTAYLRFYQMKWGTYSGQANSYAWFVRPQLTPVRPGVTTAVPYVPGTGDGAISAANGRISDEATASSNRDTAPSGRVSTTESKLNGDTESTLAARIRDEATTRSTQDTALSNRTNAVEAAATSGGSSAKNDRFAMWRDGQAYPDSWIIWNGEGNYRTERVTGNGGSPYAVRTLNDNANVESGFYQRVPIYAGKWVVEVTAESDISGFSGAGMTLHGQFSIDFLSDADTKGYVGDQGDTIRTWTKMFEFDQNFVNSIGGVVNFHAMHGWSGFGRYRAPKYMKWHHMSLRPADYGSSEAFRANARVTTEETARANAISAVSNRTSVVEAQVSNDSNNLLRNGLFNAPDSNWVYDGNPTKYPIGWGGWAKDNNAYIGPYGVNGSNKYTGGQPLQIDRNGDNNGVMQILNGQQGAGWYVIEADITCQDGNWTGCGMHVQFNNGYYRNFSFGTEADTNGGVLGGQSNVNRKFSTMYYNGGVSDQVNVYLMAGWTGFTGSGGYGFLRTIWHKAVVRPASEAEIQARKVIDSNVMARVTTTESAVSNLNGRTSAYWQVQAVAGNNRAQMTVRADANGGAGVDIVGDTTFKGNLDVGADGGGNRVKITNSGFQVFDGNGTLRAQFGLF